MPCTHRGHGYVRLGSGPAWPRRGARPGSIPAGAYQKETPRPRAEEMELNI